MAWHVQQWPTPPSVVIRMAMLCHNHVGILQDNLLLHISSWNCIRIVNPWNNIHYSYLRNIGHGCKNFQFQIGFVKFIVAHSTLL